jgi:cold shock protein
MPEGRVKRYERNSGFGFIETPEGDLFVHHTALRDREYLMSGEQVEYEVEQSDRGPRAINVRVTEEVSPKRRYRPDWRGSRGGTPHFEGQERVIPGRAGKQRRTPVTATKEGPIGPPRGEDDEDAVEEGADSTREQ